MRGHGPSIFFLARATIKPFAPFAADFKTFVLESSPSGSNRKPSNSEHRHPRKAHLIKLAFASGARDSGTSANAPVSSPSMMDRTMTQGPTANAVSALGLNAPTLVPSVDAAAVCSASVLRNHPRPSFRRPTIGPMTAPNTTGMIMSTGVSTRSLLKK